MATARVTAIAKGICADVIRNSAIRGKIGVRLDMFLFFLLLHWKLAIESLYTM